MVDQQFLAEGPLVTSGGLIGTKNLDCHVSVSTTEVVIDTGGRTERLRLDEITGTTRTEFRLAPWGPTTVQLALAKSTSNQFGPNLVILRTNKRERDAGIAVLEVLEQLVAERPSSPADRLEDAGGAVDEIRKLAALRDEGLLTEEEFVATKRQVLGLE